MIGSRKQFFSLHVKERFRIRAAVLALHCTQTKCDNCVEVELNRSKCLGRMIKSNAKILADREAERLILKKKCFDYDKYLWLFSSLTFNTFWKMTEYLPATRKQCESPSVFLRSPFVQNKNGSTSTVASKFVQFLFVDFNFENGIVLPIRKRKKITNENLSKYSASILRIFNAKLTIKKSLSYIFSCSLYKSQICHHHYHNSNK